MTSGIIITRNLVLKNNKSYVEIIGKKINSDKFRYLLEFKPYFFIKKQDLEKAQLSTKEYIETKLKTFYEEEVVRLEFLNYDEFKETEEQLLNKGIEIFESDVNQTQAFMNNYNLDTVLEFVDESDSIFYDVKKLKNVDKIDINKIKNSLKIISIDIETNYKTNEIICASLAIKFANKINNFSFVTSQTTQENTSVCVNEKELLQKITQKISFENPDVITGWNVIDFDLSVIKERCSVHKINFNIGFNQDELYITKQKSFFNDSLAKTKGIQILDGIMLAKQAFIKLTDYKLNTAANEILNDSKINLDEQKEKPQAIIDLYNEDPNKLVEYNKKDAQLVLDILDKQSLLDIAIQRSIISGTTMDRVKSTVSTMESLYLSECRKRGYVMHNKTKNTKLEGISGGFVMEPKPGLFDYVLVLDFKSLYPSIIRTFNVDLLTAAQAKKNYISAPNGARFNVDEEGILPQLVEKIWALRDEAKKQKNPTKSYALKITMNSFFGVLANPNCRYFNYDVADAITNYGRFIIKKCIEYIKEKDYDVIYGDTDSLFILSKAKDKKHAFSLGQKLEKQINDFFEIFIKEEYNRKSILQIEFEKTYKKFFMPSMRGSESGAKKRYAGLLIDNDTEKIDITGLEFVRSDWTALAKEFQYKLLEKIFYDEPYKEYIKTTVQDLKDGKLDDKLTYRKKLTKPLDEYTKTTPPHVKAARMLNGLTSNIIKYKITTEGPVPLELIEDDSKQKYDYDHYIEKQLEPIAQSILPMLDVNFEDIIKGNKQSTLDFFG